MYTDDTPPHTSQTSVCSHTLTQVHLSWAPLLGISGANLLSLEVGGISLKVLNRIPWEVISFPNLDLSIKFKISFKIYI